MSFNETFVGMALHPQLKRWPYFQYPDERVDFVPPQELMPGYKTLVHKKRNRENGPPLHESDRHQGGESPEHDDQHDDQSVEAPPSTADMYNDPYLVDWNGPDDSDNPYNWPSWKKGLFLFQIMLLTTSVYMGSSIVSPAVPTMTEYWHIAFPTASLSISLFVLGYGLGPMLWICSASEVVYIGRIIPYMLSLFLFVILQIPTALVHSVGAFMILRFLAGLFGSPPLATGGASVQDVWSPATAPLAMGMWGISAAAGPVSGMRCLVD